jgi:hypothetical protein
MIAHAKAKPKTPAPKKAKTKVIYGRQLFMMVAYEIATADLSPRFNAPLTETKPTSKASNPLYQAYSYRPQVGDAYMSTITRVRELLGAGASDTTMVL